MSSSAYELGYLKAGIESLDAYLLSDDLYWTLSTSSPPGEPLFRQLTLGGLLLNEQRLLARHLSPTQDMELRAYSTELREFISRHRVAWERKTSREFQARLKLWGTYLSEYRDDPDNQADRYAYEVERRVMLHLLAPFARDILRADLELLGSLDKLLEAVFMPGSFVWEAEVTGAFDQADFWYLYGKLRR
jgi:hypothetical protein